MTRDYLQRSLNPSNEECRKYYNLNKGYQDEKVLYDTWRSVGHCS